MKKQKDEQDQLISRGIIIEDFEMYQKNDKSSEEQNQFDQKMNDLAFDTVKEVEQERLDYDQFIKSLENPYKEAQKLGYGNSFLIFTTDIMKKIYHDLPRGKQPDFFKKYNKAQFDYEGQKTKQRVDQKIDKNKHKPKPKNRGMSM